MQLLDWHIHLDKSLPGPLGVMGAWLHRAEIALREEIPIHQAHEETANGVHRKLEQHKVPEKGGRGGNAPYLGGIPFEFVKVSTLTLLTLNLLSEPFLCVCVCVCVCASGYKEVLMNLESHRQTFQQIHRDRSVNGVPVPPEQLQDMAER